MRLGTFGIARITRENVHENMDIRQTNLAASGDATPPTQTYKLTHTATAIHSIEYNEGNLTIQFQDLLQFQLPTRATNIPHNAAIWTTVRLSPDSSSIMIDGKKGDSIVIGGGTLRYLVDPVYAAQVDKELESLQLTPSELSNLVKDFPPPQEWFNEPETDLAWPAGGLAVRNE